ncbi:metallophosphoesterase family protein [Desulfatibacillum alkenivorans]|jgi:putative phosphoesterase|uniref:metallophosphoesterase family protein n=1 Tax=Desulfatibacillum alkenivorans TaxID=259354 RepID=UPI0009FB8820|nr:YfcE family phosphodiesterase [Desulfatibacillum alkenivorans]
MAMDRGDSPAVRLGVFSDTHGNARYMQEALRNLGPFNMIIHLGDGVREGRGLADQWGLPFMGVRGNEDYGALAPMDDDISFHGFKIFMMHGHQMEINPYQDAETWERHYREMAQRSARNSADIFLFGHTHKPVLKNQEGVLICNPGDHYLGSSFPPGFIELVIEPHKAAAVLFLRKSAGRWIESAREELHSQAAAKALSA